MTSSTAPTDNYETVIALVRSWLPAQRLSLVQDVLATLTPEVEPRSERKPTVQRALGLLATEFPAPSVADIEVLLAKHRRERYGL